MLNERDPSAPPNFEINFTGVTNQRLLMQEIAQLQATKIPALLTVMTTLHDDMIRMPYDEPLRSTCDVMMRDAALRLGCATMNLMLCSLRLRELQRDTSFDAPVDLDDLPF